MSIFQTFTILPHAMTATEIIAQAFETNRIAITNGRAIILAPRVIKGYRRIEFFKRVPPQ